MSFGPSVGSWSSQTKVPFQLFFPKRQITSADLKQMKSRTRGLVLHGDYRWTPANERFRNYTLETLHNLLPVLATVDVPIYLVVHFNSGPLSSVVELVEQYQSSADSGSIGHLALENMVGAGKQVGCNLDQLRRFYESISQPYPSLCFDTQHAFAAGWLPNHNGYNDLFEFIDGYKIKLPVIHLNDSEVDFGTHKDKHGNVHLGEGKLWTNERLPLLTDLFRQARDRNIMLIDEGSDYIKSCKFIRTI